MWWILVSCLRLRGSTRFYTLKLSGQEALSGGTVLYKIFAVLNLHDFYVKISEFFKYNKWLKDFMECTYGVWECIYDLLQPPPISAHTYLALVLCPTGQNKLQVTTGTDWTQAVVHNLLEWFGHLGIPRHLSAVSFKDLWLDCYLSSSQTTLSTRGAARSACLIQSTWIESYFAYLDFIWVK